MGDILPLVCTGVVEKIGERFGEFGLQFHHREDAHMAIDASDLQDVSQWHLYVYAAPDSGAVPVSSGGTPGDDTVFPVDPSSLPPNSIAFNDVVELPKMTRVVKLAAGTRYVFSVRYYSTSQAAWSAWSVPQLTCTFYPVVAHISEVGENYASVRWERAAGRDTRGLAPERDTASTTRVGDISQMTLRVSEEASGTEVLHQRFECGVRFFTVSDLQPGTAYVVEMQYETLIGTLFSWSEVGRLYTESPLVTSLTSRGEDAFSFEWCRAAPPSRLVGYVVSHARVHQYEVSVECEGMNYSPVLLPASQTSYRLAGIVPNTKFTVSVRALSQEGRWGARSNALVVLTASRPVLTPVLIAETFATFTWTRESRVEAGQESRLEYVVRPCRGSVGPTVEKTVELPRRGTAASPGSPGSLGSPGSPSPSPSAPAPLRSDADLTVLPDGYLFHVENLVGAAQYTVSMRVQLNNEWGGWTEPLEFATSQRPSLTVMERGEDFLTVEWPQVADAGRASPHSTDNKRSNGTAGGSAAEREEGESADPVYSRSSSPNFLQLNRPGSIDSADNGSGSYHNASGRSGARGGPEYFKPSLFQVVVRNVTASRRGLGKPTTVLEEEVCPDTHEPGFRISHLDANNTYEILTRAWQHNTCTGFKGWGAFAAPLVVETLQPVALQVVDLGEDFAHISWWRGLLENNNNNSNGNGNNNAAGGGGDQGDGGATGQSQHQWDQIKYEVVVGCIDTEEDNILHVQVLESNYIINGLRPSTTYIVSVRACDERNQWGLWSKLQLRTLASVVTSVHEIGEDFLRLMWQRRAVPGAGGGGESGTGAAAPVRAAGGNVVHVDAEGSGQFVSKYAIFVFSRETVGPGGRRGRPPAVEHVESGYPDGGLAEVARYTVVSSEHTSARIAGLLPDREYVAVVRAATATGVWGLWSAPIRFRTNRQFTIPVNTLSIGENYVNLVWSRDSPEEADSINNNNNNNTNTNIANSDGNEGDHDDDDDGVVLVGDTTIISQQLRIHGVNTSYSKEHTLSPDARALKLYGLSPASAYSIQLRACGRSGCWGLWSPPVHVLTRATILTKTLEIAEDYAVVAWERRKVDNPHNFPTGRGIVSSYHLRVYNHSGIHLETFVGDADCPYRIPNLSPNTFYCVELKANYNDEEWGLWSVPLWCLTMQSLQIQTKLISEEFCCLSISRPPQPHRSPEEDGNTAGTTATTNNNAGRGDTRSANKDAANAGERMLAYGQQRPHLLLCVTSPVLTKNPHSSSGFNKPKYHSASLPPDAAGHRLIYQTEILSGSDITEHTVPNLKSNTVYSVSVRSRLPDGEWGMWAQSTLFATVPTTCMVFHDIGESFVRVEWKRHAQNIPPQLSENVIVGLGNFSSSRVRIREVNGSYQRLYSVENSANAMRLNDLAPATTYAIAVQTYNDNYNWGVWSEESKVRTVPGMNIFISQISEDALWVSWTRLTDLAPTDADIAVNVNVVAKSYEVAITGAGGFRYSKEMDSNALFFRGLQADSIYVVHVRVLFAETEEWGLWSSLTFRTKPRLRVTFGSIGEHFAVVEWRRHLPAIPTSELDPNTPVVETEDVVLQFRFKVQRVGDSVPTVYDLSPNVGSFRMTNLEPCSEYRIWMCARGYEGVWGGWNEESRLRTLPKLQLQIVDIGEDYVRVKWARGAWDGEHMDEDDGVGVRQVDGAVSGYQVRAVNERGEVAASQNTTFRETTCVLRGLDIASVYTVEVRAKDTYGEWGLWSDAGRFATLHAVRVDLRQIGETFIDLAWARMKNDAAAGVVSPVSPTPRPRNHYKMSLPFQETMPVLRDDETVLQWHVRLQCRYAVEAETPTRAALPSASVNHSADGSPSTTAAASTCDGKAASSATTATAAASTFTEEGETTEFYAEPSEEFRRVLDLIPGAEYTVSVRAQNKAKEWGHWGKSVVAHTYPLLRASVESVGETFVNMVWERPTPVSTDLVCFPPANDIHNYQVIIEPHESEKSFVEEDEPLVDGCRVYETTQPSLRLSNLVPGTSYRVQVREQQIDEAGRPVEECWGALSRAVEVRTVAPLRVVPVEIGEDYCLVQWLRATSGHHGRDAEEAEAAADTAPAILDYELHAVRLCDDGITHYTGPLALDVVVPIPPTATQYAVENLQHNTIYEISVRAKGGTGVWGLWSAPTKIVSQGRLQLRVESVYERSFIISWDRPVPSWALTNKRQQQQLRRRESAQRQDSPHRGAGKRGVPMLLEESLNQRSSDGESPRTAPVSSSAGEHSPRERDFAEDGSDKGVDQRDAGDASLTDSQRRHARESEAALAEVQLGDYTIEKYEVMVVGLSCDFSRTFDVSKEFLSVPVTELQQRQLYCVCVRSLSEGQHWSRWSNKESVCTMAPVRGVVAHLTESAVVLRWGRSHADLDSFAQLLERRRVDAERQCEEKERQELFELKKRLQELDDPEEKAALWQEQEAREERNAQIREEATHHYVLQNVATGSDDHSTGYHLQLFGAAACCPRVQLLGALRLRDKPDTPVATGVGAAAAPGEPFGADTSPVGNTHPVPRLSRPRPPTAEPSSVTTAARSDDENHERPATPTMLSTTMQRKATDVYDDDEDEESGAAGGAVLEHADGADDDDPNSGGEQEQPDDALSASLDMSRAVELVNVLLQPGVREVTITGLACDTAFCFFVSARNDRLQWQPWGSGVGFRTLPFITLANGRFGEEYIQLYWHRPGEDDDGSAAKRVRLAELEQRFSGTTSDDLARQKAQLSSAEYQKVIDCLRELKALRVAAAQEAKDIASGKGPVSVHDSTPIKGYQMRVVKENGNFVDTYIPAPGHDRSSVSATTNPFQYTVSGLKPNRMHVCLLCPEYDVSHQGDSGGDHRAPPATTRRSLWGSWTHPIKFMTQNHIQLQVTYMGETFVDIAWQRMENKRPAAADRDDTLMSSPVPSEMLHYQVRVRYADPQTGKPVEELREIDAARSFRLENLLPDTKYGLAVREKDTKGNWSQWCSERTCVTLPNMDTVASDIGETWAVIGWKRQMKKKDYDHDMDVLQYGEEAEGYFLRIEEVMPSRAAPPSPGRRVSMQSFTSTQPDGTLQATEVETPWSVEIEDLLSATQRRASIQDSAPGDQNRAAEVEEFEGTSERGGYLLVKRCTPASFSEKVEGLEPNRCYAAQVVAEMGGGMLGSWSTPKYLVTLPKLQLKAGTIGEDRAEVKWLRGRPTINGVPVTAAKDTMVASPSAKESFVLEIRGVHNSFSQTVKLPAGTTSYTFTKLKRNSVYTVRLRGVDVSDTSSLWSDPLTFVTLNSIVVQLLSVTESSFHIGWGRSQQNIRDYDIDSPTFGSLATGQAEFTSYHLRIRQCNDFDAAAQSSDRASSAAAAAAPSADDDTSGGGSPRGAFLDKIFPHSGGKNDAQYFVDKLPPDTAFGVTMQAQHANGEWSDWSVERLIRTLPSLRVDVDAVGEDFVRVAWARGVSARGGTRSSTGTATRPSGEFAVDGLGATLLGNPDDHKADGIRNKNTDGDDAPASGRRTAAGSVAQVNSNKNNNNNNNGDTGEKSVPLDAETLAFAVGSNTTAPHSQSEPHSRNRVPSAVSYAENEAAEPHILQYAVSVRRVGETEGKVSEMPGALSRSTLTGLRQDTIYHLCVRARYQFGEQQWWGTWSEERPTSTYKSLRMLPRDAGETSLTVAWERQRNSTDIGAVDMGSVEETVCYEICAEAHASSPSTAPSESKRISRADGDDEHERLHFFVGSTTQAATLGGLLVDMCYRLQVRRWFRPLEAYQADLPREEPRTESNDIRHAIETTCAVPGLFSSPAYALTLPPLKASVDKVGEDFFSLRWTRDAPTARLPAGAIAAGATAALLPGAGAELPGVPPADTRAEAVTDANRQQEQPQQQQSAASAGASAAAVTRQRFAVRVDEMLPDGTAVNTAPGRYHNTETVENTPMNIYFAEGLVPDTTYRVQVSDVSRVGVSPVFGTRAYKASPAGHAAAAGSSFSAINDASGAAPPANFVSSPTSQQAGGGVAPLPVGRQEAAAAALWTAPVYAVTLPRFRVTVDSIEEEAVQAQWSRQVRTLTLPDGTEAAVGQQDPNDVYEISITGRGVSYSFSKRLKGTRTSYSVRDLRPGALYNVQVRSSDSIRQTWGVWSDPLFFATRKPVLVAVMPPAEQFAHIYWKRDKQSVQDYDALLPDGDDVCLGNNAIVGYELCVYAASEGMARPMLRQRLANNVQHFRVTGLAPDTPYAAVVRIAVDAEEWTPWSTERTFRTLPPLVLDVGGVLETTAEVQWHREASLAASAVQQQPPDSGRDARASSSASSQQRRPAEIKVSRYLLVLKSAQGTVEKSITPDVCTSRNQRPLYRADGLVPGTLFGATLQPCYGEGEWGMVSQEVVFMTIPVQEMSVAVVRDQIELTWPRPASSYSAFESGGAAGSQPRGSGTIPRRYQVVACRGEDAPYLLRPLEEENSDPTPGGSAVPSLPQLPTSSSSGQRRRYTVVPDRDAGDAGPGESERLEAIASAKNKNGPVVCTLGKVERDATYVVRTRAQYATDEWGSWSESVVHTPPRAPTGLVLREVSSRLCALQWIPIVPPRAHARHHQYRYVVEMMQESADDDEDGAGNGIGSGRRPSVMVSAPNDEWRAVDAVELSVCAIRHTGPASRLRCRVRVARRGAAEGHFFPLSEYSEAVSVSPGAPPPPDGVTRLTIVSVSRDAARLEWRSASVGGGDVVFRVLLREEDGPLAEVLTTGDTSCELTDLHALTTYTVAVLAESAADGATSPQHAAAHFTTKSERDRAVSRGSRAEPLGEPVNLSAATREETRMNESDTVFLAASGGGADGRRRSSSRRISASADGSTGSSERRSLQTRATSAATTTTGTARRPSTATRAAAATPSAMGTVPSVYGTAGRSSVSGNGKRNSKASKKSKSAPSAALPSINRTI